MPLFILNRAEWDYDEPKSFVVKAASAAEARETVALWVEERGEEKISRAADVAAAFRSDERSSCDEVDLDGSEPAVIHMHFVYG